MTRNNLEKIDPTEAVDAYIEERKEDAAYETLETIESGLDLFLEWSNQKGIKSLSEISGFELMDFKNWCKENTGENLVSLNGTLSVVRRFLVFCVRIDAVEWSVPNKVPTSNVPDDEDVNYTKPSKEEVEKTLAYLKEHEPTSRRHVEYAIMEELGIRVGAVRAIDKCDVDFDESSLNLRHRPEKDYENEKGTPLKNKSDGERNVNISHDLCELISAHVESPLHHDITDKFGRKPLLTTKNGRPTTETIRRDLYKLTRPCTYSNNCPEDRDPQSCEATRSNHASKCPSSHSPHPLRRYSIEKQIECGVSKELLTDRVDVSLPILNRHYDTRSKERKRKHRLKIFEKVFPSYGNPEATLNIENLSEILVNDDGMIDPQALELIASNDVELQQTTSSDGSEDDDEVVNRYEDQKSLADFANAVVHPGIVPIYSASVVGAWLPGRIKRELNVVTSEPGTTLKPSRQRAAKGVAAYSVFVLLLSMNFSLLGLLPA